MSFYQGSTAQLGYFRKAKDNQKEVDVVTELANKDKILIEVKYREQAPINDDDAICTLANNSSMGIIITKRQNDYGIHNTPSGKPLLRIPAYAFLYLLGLADKNSSMNI